MLLPMKLQLKLAKILEDVKPSKLKSVQKNLTERYRTKSGSGKSLIETESDSILYALSRMPATFSVNLTLLDTLREQGFITNIKTAFDVGSGTGAGYFALSEFDKDIKVTLFERDKNMISIFNRFDTGKKVQKFDLVCDNFDEKADLVVSSYVLSELSDENRITAAKKLFNAAEKYLLLIDTGTPKVWKQMMKLKTELEKIGGFIVAPCMSGVCGLENDYCQFYARVERSSVHRIIKEATLSYEDEKYFYLLITKQPHCQNAKFRIIRRPFINSNVTTLMLCGENGVEQKDYTKRNKEEYKKAKKAKINGLI